MVGVSFQTAAMTMALWRYGGKKVTFSFPSELPTQLVKRVPAPERSWFPAQVLEKSLREGDESLIRSCLSANDQSDGKQSNRSGTRFVTR